MTQQGTMGHLELSLCVFVGEYHNQLSLLVANSLALLDGCLPLSALVEVN